MRLYKYSISFSPYMNGVRAKNRKDAWRKIRQLWVGAGYTRYQVNKMVNLF